MMRSPEALTTSSHEKLAVAVNRRRAASGRADDLALVLLSVHGALEDWLRAQLCLWSTEALDVSDAGSLQWQGLLNLASEKGIALPMAVAEIRAMNALRQRVAHGEEVSIDDGQLDAYLKSVALAIGFSLEDHGMSGIFFRGLNALMKAENPLDVVFPWLWTMYGENPLRSEQGTFRRFEERLLRAIYGVYFLCGSVIYMFGLIFYKTFIEDGPEDSARGENKKSASRK